MNRTVTKVIVRLRSIKWNGVWVVECYGDREARLLRLPPVPVERLKSLLEERYPGVDIEYRR